MKKLMFVLISSALTLVACGDNQERIDKNKVDAAVRAQNAAHEKTGQKDLPFEYEYLEVSSSENGDHETVQNMSGDLLIVGDKGIWLDGDLQPGSHELAASGSHIAADLNNRGDWIAVGNRSLFIKIKGEFGTTKLRTVDLGSSNSNFAVDINERGDWIAVGNKAVYINGIKNKKLSVDGGTSAVTASIDNELNWIVTSRKGVHRGTFIKDSGSSVDESSLR